MPLQIFVGAVYVAHIGVVDAERLHRPDNHHRLVDEILRRNLPPFVDVENRDRAKGILQRQSIGMARLFQRIDRLRQDRVRGNQRSEEHTSELQSLMRISYAVCCLKKKTAKTPSVDEKYNHI